MFGDYYYSLALAYLGIRHDRYRLERKLVISGSATASPFRGKAASGSVEIMHLCRVSLGIFIVTAVHTVNQ
jgi:hypothetical protein